MTSADTDAGPSAPERLPQGIHLKNQVLSVELGVAVGCNIVRALSGGRAEPSAVLLSHRPPEDRRPYDDVLKAPLLFDQHQTCIIISGPAMEAANPRANPVERQRILASLDALTRDDFHYITARTRHALRPQLPL